MFNSHGQLVTIVAFKKEAKKYHANITDDCQ